MSTKPVISSQEVENGISIHSEIAKCSSKFAEKLKSLSKCSTEFALLIEKASVCKGAEDFAEVLKSIYDIHHQLAKMTDAYADDFISKFEAPMNQHIKQHTKQFIESRSVHEKNCISVHNEIEKLSERMMKERKKDMMKFQQTMNLMQAKVSKLEEMKEQYAQKVLECEIDSCDFLVEKLSGINQVEYDHHYAVACLIAQILPLEQTATMETEENPEK